MPLCPDSAKAMPVSGPAGDPRDQPAAPRAADWLSLAAAPIFAAMALLTGVLDGGDICSAAQGAWPLSGMVPMYLLMSAFHSAPWLKLVSSR